MCFGSCRVTCDNCKPKFVVCPDCGHKNLLVFKACKECGSVLTEDMKDEARRVWAEQAEERNRGKRKESR